MDVMVGTGRDNDMVMVMGCSCQSHWPQNSYSYTSFNNTWPWHILTSLLHAFPVLISFSHLSPLPSSLSLSLLFHLPFFTSILPFSPSSISLFLSLPLLRYTLLATLELSTTSLQGELQDCGCRDEYEGGVMIWWWLWDVRISLTGHRRGVTTCN